MPPRNDDNIRISKLKPLEEIKPFTISTIVGKRGTGKTVLMMDIIHKISQVSKIDFCIGFAGTIPSATMFEGIMPSALIHNKIDPAMLKGIIDVQTRSTNLNKHVLIVLDDMMHDRQGFNSPVMREIFMNGRHMRITLIVCAQYLTDMKPDLRTNVDYVYALREPSENNRRKLHTYWFSVLKTYDLFSKTMDECTKNHECLVLMNNVSVTDRSGMLRWYRANTDLPAFRLLDDLVWNINSACCSAEARRCNNNQIECEQRCVDAV